MSSGLKGLAEAFEPAILGLRECCMPWTIEVWRWWPYELDGRLSNPTSYPAGRPAETSGLFEPEWPRRAWSVGTRVVGSAALPRTADDSRLCIGVDWAVRVPRRSDGDARLCDADLRSSGRRGSVGCWPRPDCLAGWDATAGVTVRARSGAGSSQGRSGLLLSRAHCLNLMQAAVSRVSAGGSKQHIAAQFNDGGGRGVVVHSIWR